MSHQPSSSIRIGKKKISLADPVYFIAEIGSNFDRDLGRAKELIHMAKEAGADAAKFQHYTAGSLVSDHGFQSLGAKQSHQATWKKSVYDTYDAASLNRDWTESLKQACDDAHIDFFTSPYSMELVDYVEPFVPAYKIGSGDITWPGIIEHMAAKGKPVLLATGASDLADVQRAAHSVLAHTPDLVLLQCNTNYTAGPNNFRHLQLNVLKTYATLFPGVILGLSDHMPGHVSVLGAVSLGARIIEKHFTDSTDREGPDHSFSMTPQTWREMVDRTRELESALGNGVKQVEENEKETLIVQRRCIRAACDIQAGTVLEDFHLSMLRPCPPDGIPPYAIEKVIGQKVERMIAAGEQISMGDLL